MLHQDPGRGLFLAGAAFGPSLPLVQVGRFQGRCYLIDGYHRAFALRQAGVTHLPCLFRDVTDYAGLGATGEYESFERELLLSADPPTCAHLAHRVPARSCSARSGVSSTSPGRNTSSRPIDAAPTIGDHATNLAIRSGSPGRRGGPLLCVQMIIGKPICA